MKAPFGFAELVVPEPGRFFVYLSDAGGNSLSPAATSGRLSVSLPNYADVALSPQGDHLEGTGAALPPATPGAVLALARSGEIHLVRFPGTQTAAPGGGERFAPGLDELAVSVTDSDCASRAGAKGEPHRECAIRCLHQGAELVLVDRDSGQIYRAVGPSGAPVQERLLPYVGYDVLVRGRARTEGERRVFEVDEVRPAHDHTPLFGGAVGMAGDLHLEALTLRSGEVRIYLSDRFRRPVAAEGQTGTIELRDGSASARSSGLLVMPDGRGLVAQVGALPATAVELRAHLFLHGIAERYAVPVDADGGFFMTFMVEPQDGAEPPTRSVSESPAASGQALRIDFRGPLQVIHLRQGEPTRLRAVGAPGACGDELDIPELGIRRALRPGEETAVEVTPAKKGSYDVRCGMGMVHGRLVVE